MQQNKILKLILCLLLLVVLLISSKLVLAAPLTIAWEKFHNIHVNDVGKLVVDKQDNIHAVVDCTDSNYVNVPLDLCFYKYSKEGNLLWEKKYLGMARWQPRDMSIDNNNNIYLAGSTNNEGGGFSNKTVSVFKTMKFDSVGNLLWSKDYKGNDTYQRRAEVFETPDVIFGDTKTVPVTAYFANGVAVDNSQNVYVAGYFLKNENLNLVGGLTGADIRVIKYDQAGNLLKEWTYNSGKFDQANDLVIDSSNNLYLAGDYLFASEDRLVRLLKYDSNGQLLWNKSIGLRNRVGGNALSWSSALDLGSDGNIYLTGGKADDKGVYLAKFSSSNGEMLWQNDYASWAGWGRDIAVNNNNQAYITSYRYQYTTYIGELSKYDSSGSRSWQMDISMGFVEMGGPTVRGNSNMDTDSAGCLYLSGVAWPWGVSGWKINKYCESVAPSVSLIANPLEITAGIKSALTWSSANATKVDSTENFEASGQLSGTLEVSPTQTTTYKITVANDAGEKATASVTVTVKPGGGGIKIIGDIFSEKNVSGITVDKGSVVSASGMIDVATAVWKMPGYSPSSLIKLAGFISKMNKTIIRLENEYAKKITADQLRQGHIYLNTANDNLITPSVNYNLKPEGRVWYLENGPLEIKGELIIHGIGTIIVQNGDVKINADIRYLEGEKSSLGIVVKKGNLEISSSVNNLKGAYFVPQGKIIFK